MLNIKVKDCEKPRTAADLKNGEFTDRVFYMRHVEFGDWYMECVTPSADLPRFALPSSDCIGLAVKECVKICLCNGAPAAKHLTMHIERLNAAATRYRLPIVEKDMLLSGIRTLIEAEQAFLTPDNCLFAHIVIRATQDHAPKTVVRSAELTVSLEYGDNSADAPFVALQGVCPLDTGKYNMGSMFDSAVALSHFEAVESDASSVLWLDNVYNKYILGLAGMNIFFRKESGVITPSDTFDGIMKTSVCTLMDEWSIPVFSQKITVDELIRMYKNGEILEVFAVSTRKGVVPVIKLILKESVLEFESGKLAKKLSDTLCNIEIGIHPAPKGMIERL